MTKVTKKLKDRWALKQWIKDYLDDHDGDTIAWEKISKDPWLYDNTVTLEDEKGAVPELEEKNETVVQNSAPEKEAEVKKTKVKKSENKDGE